jgi:hypothetical protein
MKNTDTTWLPLPTPIKVEIVKYREEDDDAGKKGTVEYSLSYTVIAFVIVDDHLSYMSSDGRVIPVTLHNPERGRVLFVKPVIS